MLVRLCGAPRLLGVVVLVLWCSAASCFTLATVDGRLVVPDIARVDNALLKTAQADKFLSLWFIHVLKDPVHTSSEPWTLLIPKNSGVGGVVGVGGGDTVPALLNHAILGHVISPQAPPTPSITSLAGTPIVFTEDADGVHVNGVRLTGEEYKFSDGVVYILESALPPPQAPEPSPLPETPTEEEGPAPASPTTTNLPTLTHRFATFKPRSKDNPRPAPAPGSRPRPRPRPRPSRPVLQPVLGEEPLTLAEVAEVGAEFPAEALAGSGFGAAEVGEALNREVAVEDMVVDDGIVEAEVEGSAASPPSLPREDQPFLASFLALLQEGGAAWDTAEFIHHFKNANISSKFRDTGRYTALVPDDAAFYSYYPIDWGFNPFLVANFTKDVLMNHFVRGNINLAELPSLAELTTLGGNTIKFTRKGARLLGNGVEVILESEQPVSRGRAYSINQLLFVDNDRISELQSQYGDLETAPLLGYPWPASQFLSHLLWWVEEQPQTSYFAEYLNLTNLAYLVPGHDENLDPRKYTAFIPTDEAIGNALYADAPDPFLLDSDLRDRLVLSHLVPGRLYQADLKPGMTLTTLANTTLTITNIPDGGMAVGEGRLVGEQTYLYNLANVFLVDHLLGISEQDILAAINKQPADPFLDTAQESVRSTPISSVDTLEPASPAPTPDTQPEPSTAPSLPLQPLTFPTLPTTTTSQPRPTTPRLRFTTPKPHPTTTPQAFPTTTPKPFPTTTPQPQPTTTPQPQPTTTPQPQPTTTPQPRPTTPRIRFETRTEISISRRVNDGDLEPIDSPSEAPL